MGNYSKSFDLARYHYRSVQLPLPFFNDRPTTVHPTVTVPSFVTVDCVTGDEGTVTVEEVTVTVGWTVDER